MIEGSPRQKQNLFTRKDKALLLLQSEHAFCILKK
jgi:hypothetical protein